MLSFLKYLAKLNKFYFVIHIGCGVKIFFCWFTKFTCFRSGWCTSSPKPHHVDYNMPLLGLSRNRGRTWPVGFLCYSAQRGEQWTLAPWTLVWPVLIEGPDIVLSMKALFVPLTSLHLLYPPGLWYSHKHNVIPFQPLSPFITGD